MRTVAYYALLSAMSAFVLSTVVFVQRLGPMVAIGVANSLVFWILTATLPSGVLAGFVVSAAIARKCGTSGTYRFKNHPAGQVVIPILTVISIVNLLKLSPETGGATMIASGYAFGGFGLTPILGAILYERTSGRRLFRIAVPSWFRPEWFEYRIESVQRISVAA